MSTVLELQENEYIGCPYCQAEVTHLPPDAIDFCPECDTIVEGESKVYYNREG